MKKIKQILESKYHNKHYLIRYIKFIESMIKTPNRKTDVVHHICPKGKHAWPEYSNLKKYKFNGVKLSHREHFIAHLILYKAFPGNKTIIYSANMMKSFYRSGVNNKLFEQLNRDTARIISETNSGKKRSYKQKQFLSKLMKDTIVVYDKNYLEDGNFRVSKKEYEDNENLVFYRTGRKHSKETIEKIGRPGKSSITDGKINKFIYPHEDIPIGFSIGHSYKKGSKDYLKEIIWCTNKETLEERRFRKNKIIYPWVIGRLSLKNTNKGFDEANSMKNVVDLRSRKCTKTKAIDFRIHAPQSGVSSEKTNVILFDNKIFTNMKSFKSYAASKNYFFDSFPIKKPHANNSKHVYNFRKKYYNKTEKDFGIEIIRLGEFDLDQHKNKEIYWNEL